MTRVPFTLLLAILALLLTPSIAEAQEKPNILFVYLDDAREDDLQYMPKTQELVGNEGLTFQNAYATFPLCCPARATTLSGLYTHNHGIKSNRQGFQKFRDRGHEKRSIAVSLDNAGYRTALFGKYLNGYQNPSYVPPGWDEWAARVDDPGQGSEFYNYTLAENGKKVRYGSKPEDYQTDVLSDKADEFIRSSSEPFFAFLPVSAPHNPYKGAPRHEGTLDNKRAETLLAVDDMVERLVSTLDELGELENTYVFFSSDNGWMLGEHGIKNGKITFYEESASVPLLVRGPGVRSGVTQKLAGNHDFAPTFADIAGASLEADGRSLVPLFSGDTEWRESLLIENPSTKRGPYKAVVTERYKYVEKKDKDRLYDLEADPTESTNFIKDEAYAEVISTLDANLDALKKCSLESCGEAEG